MPRWMSPIDRYLSHFKEGPPTDCWPWVGATRPEGYGVIVVAGRTTMAHRFGWEWRFGPIKPGKVVRHKCDNPPCQNPAHWQLGTPGQNTLDRHARGRDAYGEKHGRAILTRAQVAKIQSRYARGGITYRELADQYGVSVPLIGRIVRKEIWKR